MMRARSLTTPVEIVNLTPVADVMAPRAGIFYPGAQGAGTLCLIDDNERGAEAVLTAAALPFVIPEKTGPNVGDQPEVGYAISDMAARGNPYFSHVLYTVPDGSGQLVVMTLQPRESIGIDANPNATQMIQVAEGVGTARVGNQLYHVVPGATVVVPASVLRDVVNTSDVEPLRLMVFYTRALYAPGSVEPRKFSAQLAHEEAGPGGSVAPSPW